MVVQVTYPGVYVEEIPSGVHSVTAVATSITAFFGRASQGPINKAVRVLSLSDFERIFGAPVPGSELALAVRLFFQNGGTDCYVVRLVKSGQENDPTKKASVIVKNESNTEVLKFTAKEIGKWGNALAIEIDYDTSRPEDTYHLRVYWLNPDGTIKESEEFLNCSADPDSPRFAPELVTQNSKFVDCAIALVSMNDYKNLASQAGYSMSRRPFASNAGGFNELANILEEAGGTYKFQMSIDDGSFFEVDLKNAFPQNSSAADIETAIKDRILAALPGASVAVSLINGPSGTKVLKFESTTQEKKSITIQSAPSNDVANALMLGTVNGGVEQNRFAPLRPAPTGTFFDISKLNDLANKTKDELTAFVIDEHTIDLTSIVGTGAEKWFKSSGDKNDGIREKFRIIASKINDLGIGWTANVTGSRLILKRKTGPNNKAYALTTEPASNPPEVFFKANVRLVSLGTGVGDYIGATMNATDADPPDAQSFLGSESKHTGFYALDKVDLFNLMVIPQDDNVDRTKLWGPASVYCKAHRAFLIIDSPDKWKSYAEVLDQSTGIRSLRIGVAKDYAAVYYPKLVVNDQGLMKEVSPSGAIAGLYSRSDSSGGGGVWTAPAGENAEILGLSDLSVVLTDKENGTLNKEGVNCLRKFPSGVVSWGARTMDGADDFTSEWKYIPIRRLALMIAESLFRGTKFAVFRPNDEPLWADIRRSIRSFMMGLFRQNAFQGGSPDKAFFVKCDSETTTEDDRNLGIVNIVVGFAPLKPAEFVIIKIQQMAEKT